MVVKRFSCAAADFLPVAAGTKLCYHTLINPSEAAMKRRNVYLDHAATTSPEEAVIRAMTDCMRHASCNPSAAYSAAGDARRVMRQCRQQLAAMLDCDSAEIIFTSGGTESNNQAVCAFRGSHAAVSAVEHASVLEAARHACSVTLIPADETGYIRPEAVEAALRPETRLICLQAANNETGVLQPVRDVYAIARARHIHLHVDAVQAFGHVSVTARFCDSLALSAHKFYGPRGAGALYVRSGSPLEPLMRGGLQEGGLRAGTENIPAICGMHQAALMAEADRSERAAREAALMTGFLTRLRQSIPGMRILGEGRDRLPGVAAIHLPGMNAEHAIAALDLLGVMVSGGAACAAQSHQPSHVYTAMGLSAKEAGEVLRISVGRHTTEKDMTYAAACMAEINREL